MVSPCEHCWTRPSLNKDAISQLRVCGLCVRYLGWLKHVDVQDLADWLCQN